MRIKPIIRKIIELSGYTVHKIDPDNPEQREEVYDEDGLRSVHNHDFMQDPLFRVAYQRGVVANERDFNWHWRVHIGLWAAYSASKLEGDFVECGVNKGFLSSSIMEYLDWDKLNKTFYLMDTFYGLDERYISEEERAANILSKNVRGKYTNNPQSVIDNFAQWKNVEIVAGAIPETLDAVQPERVAYLHLDMNCTPPEVAAFNHFWDRLVPGAFVLLDDYAYRGHKPQKLAMDAAAASKHAQIASLPTGQGLLVKPAGAAAAT